MISKITLASLALALLAQPASADKFYFGSADDQKKTQGNATHDNFIQGVLLKEDKDSYTIRILGGEMQVAKSMVYKVDKDGLTVAQLEATEAGRKDALAQAETQRRQLIAAEAAVCGDDRARAAEATATRGGRDSRQLIIDIDFPGILGRFDMGGFRPFRSFDPILNRANLSGLPVIIDTYLRGLIGNAPPGAPTPAIDRDLPVVLNFKGYLRNAEWKTFDAQPDARELDELQRLISDHVYSQVRRAANRSPDSGR